MSPPRSTVGRASRTNTTGSPPAALTKGERRAVWISGAIALLTLLALFFVGLFVGFSLDNPFLPGFYWIANVIAAISTGTLASSMSGFLLVKYEHKLGRKGRFLVEGTGGAAVFLIVIWVNPQDKMFKAGDVVFSQLLSDCRPAEMIGDPGLNPNARESCVRLKEIYPGRPEPYGILGRWTHIHQSNGAGDAANLFRDELQRYGIQVNPITRTSANSLSLTDSHTPRVPDALSHFNFAFGDYLLTSFSHKDISLLKMLDGFQEIVDASYIMTEKLLNDNSDPDMWSRAYDARAKVYLYTYFIEGKRDISYPMKALSAYDGTLVREKRFRVLLEYHKFICLVLLEAQAFHTQETASAALREMLQDWSSFFNEQEIKNDRQGFKDIFLAVLSNSRLEEWKLTRPFGSIQFGGDEIQSFFEKEPALKQELTDRVNRL